MVLITTTAVFAQEEGVGEQSSSGADAPFSEQITEPLLTPFVNYLTFGIDIAAGLIIGISAIIAFISFLKILQSQRNSRLLIKRQ